MCKSNKWNEYFPHAKSEIKRNCEESFCVNYSAFDSNGPEMLRIFEDQKAIKSDNEYCFQ